jgi:hypothetical protein
VGREYELTFVLEGPALRGYLDGVPLFVVDDYEVLAGRIGIYTWGNAFAQFRNVAVYPAAPLVHRHLLDDPLQVEVVRRWMPLAEGDVDGPSAWSVVDGWMTQTSAIHDGGPANDPDKPGTYNLTGELDWQDYRLSVQMKSETTAGIGLMFRYRDSHNYYRFSMDAALGYRRLIRKAGGVVTVLWEDAVAYVSGQPYLATLDCVGHRITGYLNGLPLFSVEDDSNAAGRIALYSWGNTAARFNEVRVTPAAWMNYYQFGGEELRAAGTRLKLFSGNVADAPVAVPLEERVFRATMSDKGRPQLSRGMATMRLASPIPEVMQQRVFIDGSLFAAVPVTVLRKADGTGFFIISPTAGAPGTHFAQGEYQIRLRYRRNNKARDPESSLLSEAGQSLDEMVTLNVPWSTHG